MQKLVTTCNLCGKDLSSMNTKSKHYNLGARVNIDSYSSGMLYGAFDLCEECDKKFRQNFNIEESMFTREIGNK